jgi:hypothetical protein
VARIPVNRPSAPGPSPASPPLPPARKPHSGRVNNPKLAATNQLREAQRLEVSKRAFDLWVQGVDYSAIAAELSVKRDTVYRYVKDEVARRAHEFPEETEHHLAKARARLERIEREAAGMLARASSTEPTDPKFAHKQRVDGGQQLSRVHDQIAALHGLNKVVETRVIVERDQRAFLALLERRLPAAVYLQVLDAVHAEETEGAAAAPPK